MAWKPVKSLSTRSPQGQSHARELDRIKAPYLKRRNGDGSVSVKKGNTLVERSVPDAEDLTDGYYVLGRIGADYRIMGSATARGTFKDRGTSGSGSFVVANIQFYGGGKGLDIESAQDATSPANFDGKTYPVVHTSVYLTRNGKSATLRHIFTDTNVAGGSAPRLHPQLTSPFFGWSGTVLKDGEHVRRAYFVGMQIQDGQHRPKLYADPVKAGVIDLPVPHTPGQLCATPTVHVVDTRGKLLLLNRFMRPTYKDSSVNVGACPGVSFAASTDHGASWSSVTSDGMFSDSQSLSFLPTDPNENSYKPWAFKYNSAVRAAGLELFPTDPANSRGIAIGLVPVALNVGGSWVVRYRQKIGRFDGFTIVANITLGENSDYDAADVMASVPVPLTLNGTHGVLYLNRYVADLNQIPSNRPTLMWTDGYTTTALGVMPFASAFTGGLSGIGRGKIVCPMYDGEYSLYELTDAMTWTKRATITSAAAAADPEYWAMPNFSRLTFLRKEGRPVSASPSAPWMTNSRILPPT